jgi:hypothetical protein
LHTTNKHIVNQNFPKTWIIKKFINKQRLKNNLTFHVWPKEVEFGQLLPPLQNTKGKYQFETRKAGTTTLSKE